MHKHSFKGGKSIGEILPLDGVLIAVSRNEVSVTLRTFRPSVTLPKSDAAMRDLRFGEWL